MEIKPFIYGGTSSILAEICTYPVDTLKTRLQIQGEVQNDKVKLFKGGRYNGMIHGINTIIKEEGILTLYRGLNAALIRQASHGTLKFGTYRTLKKYIYQQKTKESLSNNVGCAVIAGVTSSAITNPIDVIKIRLQSKSNYLKNSTFKSEFKETLTREGISGLYKTVIPTATRSALIVGCQLPAYDFSKSYLLSTHLFQDNIQCHFICSIIAASCATFVSCPVEVIRTRLMNHKWHITNQSNSISSSDYRNAFGCLIKTVKNEGPLAIWKGFIPMWCRLGPWNIIFFLTQEQLHSMDSIFD